MKKNIFLSGLFMAAMALTTVFTSCEREDIKTAFQLGDATATINVTVIDAVTSSDVTSQCTINIPGADANGTITYPNGLTTAQQLTVTVTLGTQSMAETVTIQPMLQGAKATYSVTIFVGDDFTLIKNETVLPPVRRFMTTPTHGHAYAHNYTHQGISQWNENASEYILNGTVTYDIHDCMELQSWNMPDMFKELKNAIESGMYNRDRKGTYDFQVSAWALYSVFVDYYSVITTFTAKTTGSQETIGQFSALLQTCSKVQVVEVGHPGHAGAYIHGHGHGSENAGGGIISAE